MFSSAIFCQKTKRKNKPQKPQSSIIWLHVVFCACTAYKNLKATDSSHSLDNPEPQASLAAGQISPLPKRCRHCSLPLPSHSQNTNTLTQAFHSWLTCCSSSGVHVNSISGDHWQNNKSNFSTTSLGKQLLPQTAKTPKLPQHYSRRELLPSKMLATNAHRVELLRCH